MCCGALMDDLVGDAFSTTGCLDGTAALTSVTLRPWTPKLWPREHVWKSRICNRTHYRSKVHNFGKTMYETWNSGFMGSLWTSQSTINVYYGLKKLPNWHFSTSWLTTCQFWSHLSQNIISSVVSRNMMCHSLATYRVNLLDIKWRSYVIMWLYDICIEHWKIKNICWTFRFHSHSQDVKYM